MPLSWCLQLPYQFLPVQSSKKEESKPNTVSKRVAEVMSQLTHLQDPEIVPVRENELISYNVAVQIGEKLEKEGIKAIILVSPGFRSKRDFIIYNKVLSKMGVKISCIPIFGSRTPENWI